MYKNIVVFGFDNAGKSTLAAKLADELSGKAIHSLGPVPIEKMKEFMETELVNHSEPKIFDRFPILEEYIYGKVLRGENRFNDEEYNKDILSKVDLFIYCNPGVFTMLNWGSREQMDGVKENAVELINAFNTLAIELKTKGYNVREYNYHCDNIEDILGESIYPKDNTNNNLIKCSLMVYKNYLNNLNLEGCEGLSYSDINDLIHKVDKIIKEY